MYRTYRNAVVAVSLVCTPLLAMTAHAGAFSAATELTQIANNIELAGIAQTNLNTLNQEVRQVTNQFTQIDNQIRDFQNQTLNSLGFDRQEWGSVVSTFLNLRRAVNNAGAIAAKARGVDVRMRSQFKRADLYGNSALSSFQYAESYEDWIKLSHNSTDSALSIASTTFEDVSDEAELLAQLERASRTAIGRQQALEVGNMVAGSSARQIGQLRALLAQHVEQVAVFNAKNGFDRDQQVLRVQQAQERIANTPEREAIDWRERAADREISQ